MKNRILSLYVENDVGVLAKISGLFSGKSYNLEGLTVGVTEDQSISRMTIRLKSDDSTFEQIKKQLSKCVEIIEVIDFTNMPIHMKELMLLKIKKCSENDKAELFRITQVFCVSILDYGLDDIVIESIHSEEKNSELIQLLNSGFKNIEVVRGGSVAIESV